MKKVSGLILKLLGWKIHFDDSFKLKKAVVIMAPHTSMIDFWLGRLAFWHLRLPVKFIIKKELFWFPMGQLLKMIGGVPIDRSKGKSVTDSIVDLFNCSEKLMIVITPEGTRKLVHNWKKGFHIIAQKAQVPVLVGYVDYKTKTGGVKTVFFPKSDFEKDLEEIQQFYVDVTARYPKNFNLSPENRIQK